MVARAPFDLVGRTALVTGANTGIGQGIALALAEAGATVVAAGRSSMTETVAKITNAGGRCLPLAVDLQQPGIAAEAVTRAAEAAGPLDILVNNAGIIRRADALDFSESDWDEVMNVNLKASFFLSQAFAKAALAAGRTGRIVNIASLLSFQGGIRVASYTASKSGLAGLTRLLACEWAGKGINVNAIAPGYIESNNTQALREDADRNAAILARIPAGRWGKPSDIGGAAVFLASDAAAYVHGAIIPVDGGWLAR
ncbi:2-dehydro-3-deoxy-D-gluconate 5-dehydrogenase KduD [Bosea sp. 2RAB26]|uniref:2-dehydro-3-deoxy-D-gluconate 5-dehydrogenase KduD n=1 Tax=Bosea sp. 2RAB26 TaxID=3237476 RepID=UPI003F935657